MPDTIVQFYRQPPFDLSFRRRAAGITDDPPTILARQKAASRTPAIGHVSGICGRKDKTILAPPKSPSASERAYIAIERLLVTGHIEPRSIVNEMEICKSLGLGRTPVRLALQRLADHGLLEIIPRRGMFVTEVDFQGQLLILETRRELDRLLCETANALATESDRSALKEMAREVEDAHMRRDFAALLETDLQFKLLLLSIARNRFLTKAIVPIHALSRRFYFMHTAETDQGVDVALVHLIRTVADGDRAAVGAASCKLTDELERFAKETILTKLGIEAGFASGSP